MKQFFSDTQKMPKIIILLFSLGLFFFIAHKIYVPYKTGSIINMFQTIIEEKEEFINNFINKKVSDISTLAQKQLIQELATSQKELQTPETKKALTSLVQQVVGTNDLYDFFIFSPQGNTRFVLNKDQFLNKNFVANPLKNTEFGKSLTRCMVTLAPDTSHFTNIFTTDKPSFLICAPVFSEKRLQGFVGCEINPQQLFTALHDKLGTTGEILLGQETREKTVIINQVRNNPAISFKENAFIQQDSPLQQAVSGKSGSGIHKDYRHKKIIAVWDYVAITHGGIVVKIDYHEAHSFSMILYLLYLILFALSLICVIGYWYVKRNELKIIQSLSASLASFYQNHKPDLHQTALLTCFGISIFAVLYSIHGYQKIYLNAKQLDVTESKTKAQYLTQRINNILYQMEKTTKDIADDLWDQELTHKDLEKRIAQEITSNPRIYGIKIAFEPFEESKAQKLSARYWLSTKKGVERRDLDQLYDYTQDEKVIKVPTQWYTQSIEHGNFWSQPYLEYESNKHVISFSTRMYHPKDINKKKPIGIVAATLRLKSLRYLMQEIGNKEIGAEAIVAHNGSFIYHGNRDILSSYLSLYDVDFQKATELKKQNYSSADMNKILFEHYLHKSADDAWVYLENIAITNWLLGIAFQEKIDIPVAHVLNQSIWIIIAFMIFAYLGITLLLRRLQQNNFMNNMLSLTIVLAVGSMSLWSILHNRSWTPGADILEVSDKATLHKFLDDTNQYITTRGGKKLIPLKTGLEINALDIESRKSLGVHADMWLRFNKERHQNIIPKDGQLPPITITQHEKFTLEETSRKDDGKYVIINYKIAADLDQTFDYKQYPFNKLPLLFELTYNQKKHPVILVPDLTAYETKEKDALLWIDKKLKIQGHSITQSFFSFEQKVPTISKTTMDPSLESFGRNLQFNILLQHNIFDDFIAYILPILVTFLAIFAILWMDADDRIKAYTGLLFTTLLIQKTLRDSFQINEIIYLEYYFFFIYATLLVFIVFSIYVQLSKKLEQREDDLAHPVKLIYWPIQLCMWFILTMLVFYH